MLIALLRAVSMAAERGSAHPGTGVQVGPATAPPRGPHMSSPLPGLLRVSAPRSLDSSAHRLSTDRRAITRSEKQH